MDNVTKLSGTLHGGVLSNRLKSILYKSSVRRVIAKGLNVGQ